MPVEIRINRPILDIHSPAHITEPTNRLTNAVSTLSFDPNTTPGLITVSWDMTVAADQRLRRIDAYWASRCRDHHLPARSDIDPLDVPALLQFIFLVDLLDDPRDFRFRLAGTHLQDSLGIELTGRLIGEVFPPEFNAGVRYHWSECADRRAPAVGSGKLWIEGREHVEWEGVLLPLSPPNEAVNMLWAVGSLRSEDSKGVLRARAPLAEQHGAIPDLRTPPCRRAH